MAQISVQNLSFSYPGSDQNVFDNASFSLDTDWKLGLIGGNGRGKTTLLRLLQGDLEDYSGRISIPVPAAYFPYRPPCSSAALSEVIREVRPDLEEWQFLREFSRLGLADSLLDRTYSTLSGGEQTKALLAALFAGEDRFLLIDEPLNHLDEEGRALVARYMAGKRGFLVASHDRAFLDACTDHTLALNKSSVELVRGSYSVWREGFDRREASEEQRNAHLRQDIARLERTEAEKRTWANRTEKIKKSAYDSGYVGHKAAKQMKRAKAVERRRKNAVQEKQELLLDRETDAALRIRVLRHHADVLAVFQDAAAIYDGLPASQGVSFEIRQGERIRLSGPNGSGKSSLMHLLLPDGPEHMGSVRTASGLKVSFVPQTTQHLTGSLADIVREAHVDGTLLRTLLYKMGFARTQFDKNAQEFSEGQKKKILLAKSLCEGAHLYVWDEPLNFVDIRTRLQLEQMIQDCGPTLVFTEHDAAFAGKIATRTVQIAAARYI